MRQIQKKDEAKCKPKAEEKTERNRKKKKKRRLIVSSVC